MWEKYFHEDDYCQVEVLPAANFDFCLQEVAEMERFLAAHETEYGWSEIYVGKENPVPLAELGLALVDLDGELAKVARRYASVSTGYGSARWICQDVTAYGLPGSVTLLVKARHHLVTAMWFDLDFGDAHDVQKNGLAIFDVIRSQGDLVLADWAWGVVIRLGNDRALRSYLDARVESNRAD